MGAEILELFFKGLLWLGPRLGKHKLWLPMLVVSSAIGLVLMAPEGAARDRGESHESHEWEITYSLFGAWMGFSLCVLGLYLRDYSTRASADADSSAQPSASQVEPKWLPLLGHVWTGVKVYSACDTQKEYVFDIIGGSYRRPEMPSGSGLLVLCRDGSLVWRDRLELIGSGAYFVREDDPALHDLEYTDFTDGKPNTGITSR